MFEEQLGGVLASESVCLPAADVLEVSLTRREARATYLRHIGPRYQLRGNINKCYFAILTVASRFPLILKGGFYFFYLIFLSCDFSMHVEGLLPFVFCYFIKVGTMFAI